MTTPYSLEPVDEATDEVGNDQVALPKLLQYGPLEQPSIKFRHRNRGLHLWGVEQDL